MKTATRPEMLEAVRNFVAAERERLGMKSYPGPQPEMSCFQFGEFNNLLNRHLLFTHPNDWGTVLADQEILEGVYREVEWDRTHAHH